MYRLSPIGKCLYCLWILVLLAGCAGGPTTSSQNTGSVPAATNTPRPPMAEAIPLTHKNGQGYAGIYLKVDWQEVNDRITLALGGNPDIKTWRYDPLLYEYAVKYAIKNNEEIPAPCNPPIQTWEYQGDQFYICREVERQAPLAILGTEAAAAEIALAASAAPPSWIVIPIAILATGEFALAQPDDEVVIMMAKDPGNLVWPAPETIPAEIPDCCGHISQGHKQGAYAEAWKSIGWIKIWTALFNNQKPDWCGQRESDGAIIVLFMSLTIDRLQGGPYSGLAMVINQGGSNYSTVLKGVKWNPGDPMPDSLNSSGNDIQKITNLNGNCPGFETLKNNMLEPAAP